MDRQIHTENQSHYCIIRIGEGKKSIFMHLMMFFHDPVKELASFDFQLPC